MTVKDSHPTFRSGFIALIGRPNVGKSTLLNRILGQKIAITSDKPQTTRNRILGIHTTDSCQMLFLDTPGLHRAKGGLNAYMVEQAVTACDGVDHLLLLVEAGDRPPEEDHPVTALVRRGRTPISLVINKIDLLQRQQLLAQIAAFSAWAEFREVVPVSARTGDGVPELLRILEGYLPEGPPYYPEDMVTDLPERFIAAEMVREKVMRRTRQEIPYGTAVIIEQFEERPDDNLVVLHAAILVERESHRKIVLGRGGEMIKAIGQDARREIERFLGVRVYLELYVKVEKNWTRSASIMRQLGYH